MTARVAVAGRRRGDRAPEERRLDAYAASAAHSIGASVSVVNGYATLLREHFAEPLGPDGMAVLRGLEGGLGRLRVFMDDLLELAALEARTLDPATVDLASVAAKAVAGLAGPLDEAGIEVRLGSLPDVTADRAMLERLFHHLVRGALAAMAAGPGRIAMSATCRAAGTRIEVTDTGPPLDPAQAAGLFESFAPPRGSGTAVGAGVGMAIARRIAERHGGSIWAHTGRRAGCTIVVLLPESTA